ncbi:hypothetical protein RISW2_17315 [Roseivivax isoporae LMG 25204]|uniref:Uncharacterized protein n=1 Tax=Roseivivax isoporae LMG 25204 TaxID=1449351 RepID=X7F2G9_9RHOB|nr:hypothetical protein RISW2_17315 [Roseivivax isoporae LMG 25204]
MIHDETLSFESGSQGLREPRLVFDQKKSHGMSSKFRVRGWGAIGRGARST